MSLGLKSFNKFFKHRHCVSFALGTNGQVTYGGISEKGFSINTVTGIIMTTKSLDRELQEYYTVTGTAWTIKHT